jgi:AraC family transcriptional regulator
MSIFKKIFRSNSQLQAVMDRKEPDNTRLNFLLDAWGGHQSDENYHDVMDEIMNGNSYLLLPSVNSDKTNGWKTAEAASTIKLSSVYNLDGLLVLGVFSDEQTLTDWTHKPAEYTAMRTQDVLDLCRQRKIDRIIINNGQKNMYVLERNRDNIIQIPAEERANVLLGEVTEPLSPKLMGKLLAALRKVDTITEAYLYMQSLSNDTSYGLGVCMNVNNEHSRLALQNAVNMALVGEHLDIPVDVTILEKEDWLNAARSIRNSLIYMKCRIEVMPEKKLVGKHMRMSLADNKTGLLWSSFMPHRKEINNTVGTDMYSMQVYDDATYFNNFILGAEFTKWAAVEVAAYDKIPHGMDAFTLPGGLYAVFLHKGGPATAVKTFQHIFNTWLPNSEYALDDRPHFELIGEKYSNTDPNSEEEIWIPVKPRVA